MQVLHELINRVRGWRLWSRLRHPFAPRGATLPPAVPMPRMIMRQVTRQGIRVFSLCGSCGAPLSASATLCEGCARARSRRAPRS